MTLRRILTTLAPVLAAALCAVTAAQAATGCAGRNLLQDLPAETRAALDTAAGNAPYARGNLWQAARDGRTVTLVGSYHLDDPRHAATVDALAGRLRRSSALLVEAGPDEQKALMALMARDPQTILAPADQSLRDTMTPEEWDVLAAAMRDRGMPAFMTARLRPWYVMMLLAIPPCAIEAAKGRQGLDQRLIDVATAADVPVRGLEPFDTALRVFDGMPLESQLAMVRSTLALEDRAEDQMATLATVYFAEDSRLMWEYQRLVALTLRGATPASVEAEFAALEDSLMNRRNRAWVPLIEQAAERGPVVAAVGALHLSGDQGVLALLAQNGWTLERLPFPAP